MSNRVLYLMLMLILTLIFPYFSSAFLLKDVGTQTDYDKSFQSSLHHTHKKCTHLSVSSFKVLFDNTKNETAGKADWVINGLYSDYAEVYMDNANEYLQSCYIVQDEPMPCTVLAMIPEVEV